MNKNGDVIRKHCLPEESIDEAIKKIMGTFAETFTQEDALDIILAAGEDLAGHKESEDWSPLDKITWAVRHAYMCGASYATNIMFQMIQMGAEDADKEGVAA